MPAKKPVPESCQHFGALLRDALELADLRDLSMIGKLVAGAQEDPERDRYPYHPEVVRAWLEGRLLPTQSAFDALSAMLADKIPPHWEDAYEAALFEAPPATEISIVLQHRIRQSEKTLDQIGQLLKQEGICGPLVDEETKEHKPLSRPALANYCSGTNSIPAATIAAFDQILPPKDEPFLSLAKLHQLSLPTPVDYKKMGAEATRLADALCAMRKALGFTLKRMAAEITAELEEGRSVCGVAVMNWEKKIDVPSRFVFQGTDPITAYGAVLRKHRLGEWADQHDAQWRQLLRQAIDERNHTNHNHCPTRYEYDHQPADRTPALSFQR